MYRHTLLDYETQKLSTALSFFLPLSWLFVFPAAAALCRAVWPVLLHPFIQCFAILVNLGALPLDVCSATSCSHMRSCLACAAASSHHISSTSVKRLCVTKRCLWAACWRLNWSQGSEKQQEQAAGRYACGRHPCVYTMFAINWSCSSSLLAAELEPGLREEAGASSWQVCC